MAVAPRCKPTSPRSFTIGERAPKPAEADGGDSDDDNQELALPNAVEIGAAIALPHGFGVAGLRSVGGGSGAFVALVDAPAGTGRVVELGRTYGGADPPRLATRGERLFAVVPDSDASSGRLRLASIGITASPPSVTWGGEISAKRDESAEFALEVGETRGVVVWDEFDKKSRRGMIKASTFAAADLANLTQPRTISPDTRDSEAPHLAPRPGGFWLAWMTRGTAAPKPPAHEPKPKPAARPAPSAKAAEAEPAPDESVLRVGVSAIEIVPLDANGSPTGEPRMVTTPRAHVMAFDLAAARDGTALLAWRDDDTAPGVESGSVHLARIGLDGSVTRSVIDDDQGGAGVPSLLIDRSARPTWLALASVTDATRLGALGAQGDLLDSLAGDPLLGNAEPLALEDGRFLLARPRGMAVELAMIDCVPGPKPSPAANEPDASDGGP